MPSFNEIISLCQPEAITHCDGSKKEYEDLCQLLIKQGTFIPLKRPGSFWCHSSKEDVARTEQATYICSKSPLDAGPTNQWEDPAVMKKRLHELFSGCMRGRTLYIVPYLMGPPGSPYSRAGVELTDSPYVVVSMHHMTRVAKEALAMDFSLGIHSVGAPLKKGDTDALWPCCVEKKLIAHFPEERSVWSFGSGYGGNALLSKKCFALRIASVLGREEGWLAEHMLLIGVTSPEGKKRYMAAAFPSQCGKTNLALLESSLPGWKVECIGDDIAWIHVGNDGGLWAINPEAGFFGVAPGTSWEKNPSAMRTISKNTIFTNVARTVEGDVWWEGMSSHPPEHLIDWTGHPWKSASKTLAAHPNARYTVSLNQCPTLDPAWQNPQGVPLSAILFGARRASLVPLALEAFSWQQGVLLGASISSETTAAAEGTNGVLRHDPFAMLPFCGYHMGKYFQHWLDVGKKLTSQPRIFQVNWFRRDKEGKFLWPGFSENIHVLKWIFERCEGSPLAQKSPIGYLPQNLKASKELLEVDVQAYLEEVEELKSYFALFGDTFPGPLHEELSQLKERLSSFKRSIDK